MTAALITLMLLAPPAPKTASIDRMSWLVGTWTSLRPGAVAEEVWTAPRAGTMTGTFRLVEDGKTRFVELLTLRQEGAALVLRIRHFDENLTPWPDERTPLVYRSVSIARDRVRFESKNDKMQFLTMQHRGKRGDAKTEALEITLTPRDGGKELAFRFTR